MHTIDGRNKNVLIISDTHIPYSHPDYIPFLKEIKRKLKPEIIIHIGDELDYHAISFHDSDAELLSAGKELDKSIIEIQEGLHKLFPEMSLLESNHGSLIFRKMKAHGLPIRTIKPLKEIYETPLWNWYHDIVLKTRHGDTYLCHGKTATYAKLSKEMGMNAIQGHYHGKSCVIWNRSAMIERYDMFVGCLVDEDGLAMAYGKNNLPKPIMSVGFIKKDGQPLVLKMRLNKEKRWTGKL